MQDFLAFFDKKSFFSCVCAKKIVILRPKMKKYMNRTS